MESTTSTVPAVATRPVPVGNIQMTLQNNSSRVKAFVNVTYAGMVLKGLRVPSGDNGMFVAPPSELGNDNKWHSHYYFANSMLRAKVTEAILTEYRRLLEGGEPQPRPQEAAPVVLQEPPTSDLPDDIPF